MDDPSLPPDLVAEALMGRLHDAVVRGDDGAWRLAAREVRFLA